MKLEARYHRILEARDRSPICVASIRDFKNGRLLVHFDGWTADYDYWYDSDSIDLHPMAGARNTECHFNHQKVFAVVWVQQPSLGHKSARFLQGGSTSQSVQRA